MKHFKNILKSTGIILVISGIILFDTFIMGYTYEPLLKTINTYPIIYIIFDTALYLIGAFFMWKIVFKDLTKNKLIQLAYIAVSLIVTAAMIHIFYILWYVLYVLFIVFIRIVIFFIDMLFPKLNIL